MSWFTNLRLQPKLMAAFALVLAMSAGMGVFAVERLGAVKSSADELGTNWMPSVLALDDIHKQIEYMRVMELRHVLSTDDASMAQIDAELRTLEDKLAQTQATYVKLISSPEEQTLWGDLKTHLAANQALTHQALDLSRKGDREAARSLAEGSQAEEMHRTRGKIDQLVALNHKGGDDSRAAAQAVYQQALWFIGASIGLLVLIGLGLAYAVAKSIAQPVQQAAGVLKAVADGDLTHTVHCNRSDEVGEMQRALAQMIDKLSALVQQVRMGADSVATASSQIAQGNVDLSSRTEEQASSLQQTAASIEQMSGTVRTNADNAHQANQLASAASEVAVRGGDVVSRVVETMSGIQSASKKISDIIGVIDGIAFQTNILALNAAVEAARAGEQGRGFAVVASEVRSLAQRSAQAAREIKTLINDSVEKVNSGSELVSSAGSTMGDVVNQVRKVTDLVGEIAHASTEQSQGIGQINQAVGQLDQMTQQNAALVEQSMAAAESLKGQAERLAQAVGVFKTRQAHDAQFKAQQVIQQARQQSAMPKPAAADHSPNLSPLASKPAPATPKATVVRAAPAALAPQLPPPPNAPSHAGTATGGKDSDDWETF